MHDPIDLSILSFILISIQHLLSLNFLPGSAKVFVFALQELIIVDYSFNYTIEPFAPFF